MKMKMAFSGLVVALFALNALPVQATDFSGYVYPGMEGHFAFGDVTEVARSIAGGKAWIITQTFVITNIGDEPLTEAIETVTPLDVVYYDESGTLVYVNIDDPVKLTQLLQVVNSEEILRPEVPYHDYVIWLGTIMPGHSKRVRNIFWIGVSNLADFGYSFSILCLP